MKLRLLTAVLLLHLGPFARAQQVASFDGFLLHTRLSDGKALAGSLSAHTQLLFPINDPKSTIIEAWQRYRPESAQAFANGLLVKPLPLSDVRQEAWNRAFILLREHRSDVIRGDLLDVEPDLAVSYPSPEHEGSPAPTGAPDAKYHLGSPVMPFWSDFTDHKAGHLENDFSQLASAYARTHGISRQPAHIAILDIGVVPAHLEYPLHREALQDAADPDRTPAGGHGLPGQPYYPPPHAFNGVEHGTATSGILAGQGLDIEKPSSGGSSMALEYFSGGNPSASVVSIRIGKSVAAAGLPVFFSRVGDVAKGFYMAVQSHAEIISMSVGGAPSKALASAVNLAYDAGIPMFCATGDYIQTRELPIVKTTLRTPWLVAYPAAFASVMAVCGVTARLHPYGSPERDNWGNTILLGNFGPSERMTNALAGWGPNIPWAHFADFAQGHPHDDPWDDASPGADWTRLDLDGGGTSADTPQVAAAASLILEYHRDDPQFRAYTRWQRVEAIYKILRDSADKQKLPASQVFFGNGFLKADDALRQPLPDPTSLRRHKAEVSYFYYLEMLLSIFDPPPSPPAERERQARRRLGELVARIEPDLKLTEDTEYLFPGAVAAASETELEQACETSLFLQDWLSRTAPDERASHRGEFLELLLRESLSPDTRRLIEAKP
jgi:hypothetical protein